MVAKSSLYYSLNDRRGWGWELGCWVEGRREKGREFDSFKTNCCPITCPYVNLPSQLNKSCCENPTLRRKRSVKTPTYRRTGLIISPPYALPPPAGLRYQYIPKSTILPNFRVRFFKKIHDWILKSERI